MLTILLKKENIHMLRVTFQKSKSDPITALQKMTASPNASQMKSRLQQSLRNLCTVWCMPSFLPVLSITTLSPTMLCSSHTELEGPQMCRACCHLHALPLQNNCPLLPFFLFRIILFTSFGFPQHHLSLQSFLWLQI